MPVARTRDEIITKARQLCDQEDGGTGPAFVDAAEALDRVNDAISDFWELLITGGRGELVATITEVTPGSATAPTFPTDFLQLLRLDVQVGGDWEQVRRLPEDEINDWQSDTSVPRYYELLNVHATPIVPLVYPTPDQAYTYRVRYVPEAPALTEDGADPAVTSLTLPNRWWRWIEHTVAIGLCLKEESDPSGLAAERQRIGDRILSTALAVDQTEAARVKDVRGRFVDDVRFRRDLATFGRRAR